MITAPIMTTSLTAAEITPDIAIKYIRRHQLELPRLQRLERYYDGRHAILDRQKTGDLSNNKIVTNHAAYIANFTSAYLL